MLLLSPVFHIQERNNLGRINTGFSFLLWTCVTNLSISRCLLFSHDQTHGEHHSSRALNQQAGLVRLQPNLLPPGGTPLHQAAVGSELKRIFSRPIAKAAPYC